MENNENKPVAEHQDSAVLVCINDIKREEIKWRMRNKVPEAKLVLTIGVPGCGKSLISVDFAARYSTGRPFPFSDQTFDPADVIFVTAEDGLADTYRPRLEEAEADLKRIHFLTHLELQGREQYFTLGTGLKCLEDVIVEKNAGLVVIDPISSFYGSADSHKDSDMRELLMPLIKLAEKRHVTFQGIAHTNKSGGSRAINRAMGSIGIIGAARSALLIDYHPDDPDRRVMVSIKANLSIEGDGVTFQIVGGPKGAPKIIWDTEPYAITADELMDMNSSGRTSTSGKKGQAALDFLKGILAPGPVNASVIEQQRQALGISESTFKRAKEQLGVISFRTGGIADQGAWLWRLPEAGETNEGANESS